MILLRLTCLFLWTGIFAIQAAEPENGVIFGINPDLSAGADALRARDYEEGLRLTLDGLKSPLSLHDRVSALSNLCAAYLGLGRFAEALESCDRALELNDRNWRIYNNRALAQLGMGRIAAAREDLVRGLGLKPDSQSLERVGDLIEEQTRNRAVFTDPADENE